MNLSLRQLDIVESDLKSSVFLSGPAGTGKTFAGVSRLNYLVNNGIPGNTILLLSRKEHYHQSIRRPSTPLFLGEAACQLLPPLGALPGGQLNYIGR